MSLPPAIEHYLERALAVAAQAPEAVRLKQEGAMWMKPGGSSRPFTATEHYEVGRVAFSWRARFRVLGPLAFQVVDACDQDHGLLELRVLGVRVQRQTGPDLALGEALRYFAELPWVPHAMRQNRELEWRQLDDRNVEVAAQVAGQRAALTFALDLAGDIVRGSARRRTESGKESPWGVDFSDYALVDGMRIPAVGEAYWGRDDDRFVYWRGRVLSVSAG
jgi:hypothetical protein